MNKFLVSEEAYNEFKAFLVENEVENFSIRINLAGFGCSGPAFNITVDDVKEGDIIEITFANRKLKAKIVNIAEHVRKENAKEMYEILEGIEDQE